MYQLIFQEKLNVMGNYFRGGIVCESQSPVTFLIYKISAGSMVHQIAGTALSYLNLFVDHTEGLVYLIEIFRLSC